MAIVPTPKRGEIWVVKFDPSVGAEIQKHRPAAVINVDDYGRLPLRLVVPITDWKPHYINYPWFAYLAPSVKNGLFKESGADAFQIKSLSCKRFTQQIGTLTAVELRRITDAIGMTVGAL